MRLEWFTIGWNSLEALVAIGAGVVAGSIALIGFGLDSVIETAAGLMVLWRMLGEVGGAEEVKVIRAERRALTFVGATFLALAVYICYESGGKLWRQEAPSESWVGIALAICSSIVMPLLAARKRAVARALGSAALEADAVETAVCAYLSLTLLFGLGANALFGWWWADPVAALAMLPLILKEGLEALKGEACCGMARLCGCACCVPDCQATACVCEACLCC